MIAKIKPTDAELDILRVLWEYGACTVRKVHELLPGHPPRGYTTVLKLMQIMSEKHLVRRDEAQRAHVYEATISPEQVQGSMLKHILERAFGNSTSKLVQRALASNPTSREELAEIRRLLDRMEEDSQ
jgi:predicted transcriptional regulator